jgi:hypothetical protein
MSSEKLIKLIIINKKINKIKWWIESFPLLAPQKCMGRLIIIFFREKIFQGRQPFDLLFHLYV